MTTSSTVHAVSTRRRTVIGITVLALLGATPLAAAKFGFDPAGLSDRWAALRPSASKPSFDAADTVIRRGEPFRSGGMTVTIAPGEGTEVLAEMGAGDAFVFAWASTGASVNFDMHGEIAGDEEGEFVSYLEDQNQQDGFGSFTAPFDGTHGWYWHNPGSETVTIHVTISGYFDELFHADDMDSHDRPLEIECCYPAKTPQPETT